MAERRFTVRLDAEMNISQVKSAVQTMQTELGKLNLPQDVGSKLTGTFDKLTGEIERFQAMSAKGIGSSQEFNSLASSGNKILQLYEQLSNQVRNLGTLSDSQLQKMFPPQALANIQKANAAMQQYANSTKGSEKQIDKLEREIAQAEKATEKLRTQKEKLEGKSTISDTTFKQMEKDADAAEKEFREAEQALKDLQKQAQQYEQNAQETQGSSKKARQSSTYRDLVDKSIPDQEKEVAKLEQAWERLKNKKDKALTQSRKDAAIAQLNQDIQTADGNTEKLRAQLNQLVEGNPQGLSNLVTQLNQINGINLDPACKDIDVIKQAIARLSQQELEKLKNSFVQAGNTVNGTRGQFQGFQQQIDQTRNKVNQLDSAMGEVDMLKSRISYFFGLTNTVYLLRRALTSAFETVKELDKTMTEAAVVTDFSVSDMWDKLPQYANEANKLGTSINSLYAATTLYYQQGLKTNEAMSLGIETMKMARIAGMESSEATEAMTAALRGFNMELTETSATRVNDVYSKLAAITASNVEQISTAMSKTASIANSANMEFETTAALLAQIIETTQEAPETAGTAMKTIIARFTEVKQLFSQGQLTGEDSEGESIDINKIDKALKTVGISLKDFLNGSKGIDDIFLELAEKWDTLDLATQRYIATMAAGSRQQSRFIAMMSDYDRTMELVGAANNSAGASQQQFNKTLESLDAKLEKLGVAWESFLMGIADNEIIKDMIDLLTDFIGLINKITTLGGKSSDTFSIITKLGLTVVALRGAKALLGKGITSLVSTFTSAGNEAGVGFFSGLSQSFALRGGRGQNLAGDLGRAFDPVQYADTTGGGRLMVQQNMQALGQQYHLTSGQVDELTESMANGNTATQTSNNFLAKNKVMLKQQRLQMLKSTLTIAGIVAAIAIVLSMVEKYKEEVDQAFLTTEEQLSTLTNIENNLVESTDKLAESLENLGNTKSDFKGLIRELKNVKKGTAEWAQKMHEARTQMLDIFETYPELRKYTETVNGITVLTDEGWAQYEKALLNTYYGQMQSLYSTKINKNEVSRVQRAEQLNLDTSSVTAKEEADIQKGKTYGGYIGGASLGVAGYIGGTALGAKLGGAIGTVAGPLGTVIGAILGVALGALIGGLAGGSASATDGIDPEKFNEISESALTYSKDGKTGFSAQDAMQQENGEDQVKEFLKAYGLEEGSEDFKTMFEYITENAEEFDEHTSYLAQANAELLEFGRNLGAINAEKKGYTGESAETYSAITAELVTAEFKNRYEKQYNELVQRVTNQGTTISEEKFTITDNELIDYFKKNHGEEFDFRNNKIYYKGTDTEISDATFLGKIATDKVNLDIDKKAAQLFNVVGNNQASSDLFQWVAGGDGLTYKGDVGDATLSDLSNMLTEGYSVLQKANSLPSFEELYWQAFQAHWGKDSSPVAYSYWSRHADTLDYGGTDYTTDKKDGGVQGPTDWTGSGDTFQYIVHDPNDYGSAKEWIESYRREAHWYDYLSGGTAATLWGEADGNMFHTKITNDGKASRVDQAAVEEWAISTGKFTDNALAWTIYWKNGIDTFKTNLESLTSTYNKLQKYTYKQYQYVTGYNEQTGTLTTETKSDGYGFTFLEDVDWQNATTFIESIEGLVSAYGNLNFETMAKWLNNIAGAIPEIEDVITDDKLRSDILNMIATTDLKDLNDLRATRVLIQQKAQESGYDETQILKAYDDMVEGLEELGIAISKLDIEQLIQTIEKSTKIANKIRSGDEDKNTVFDKEELDVMLSLGVAQRNDFFKTEEGYIYLGDSMEELRKTILETNSILLGQQIDALRAKVDTGQDLIDAGVGSFSWGAVSTWDSDTIQKLFKQMWSHYGLSDSSTDAQIKEAIKGTPLENIDINVIKQIMQGKFDDLEETTAAAVKEILAGWGDAVTNLGTYKSQLSTGLVDSKQAQLAAMNSDEIWRVQQGYGVSDAIGEGKVSVGQKISFTDANGKTVSGVVQADGTLRNVNPTQTKTISNRVLSGRKQASEVEQKVLNGKAGETFEIGDTTYEIIDPTKGKYKVTKTETYGNIFGTQDEDGNIVWKSAEGDSPTYSATEIEQAYDAKIQQENLEAAYSRTADEFKGTDVEGDTKRIKAHTVAVHESAEAIDEMNQEIANQAEALEDVGSERYDVALSKIADQAKEVFGEHIDANFVKENIQWFKDLAKGGEAAAYAWKQITQAAAAKLEINPAFLTSLENAGLTLEWVRGIANQIDGANLQVGVGMDMTNFLEGMKVTEQNAAILSQYLLSRGYKVVWTQVGEDENGLPLFEGTVEKLDLGGTGLNPYSNGGGGNEWENPYDKLHNELEKINDVIREREKLERRYQSLLDRQLLTLKEARELYKGQMDAYDTEAGYQRHVIAERYKQIEDEIAANPGMEKYVQVVDDGYGGKSIRIDWDALEAKDGKDWEKGEDVEAFYDSIKEWLESIYDAEETLDEIADGMWELINQGKDEYLDLENQIIEALVNERQAEIDKLSEINETITDTNSKLLESMQEQLDEYRQNRDNEKTEEELSDKQRKIAYLQQDTSGANAVEIMQLQEELDEATEDYTDTLIDQKINELQEQNDKAAEQRQQQIDILQAQLDHDKEIGAFNEKAEALIDEVMANDGIISGTELESLLKDDQNWEAMTKLGQMSWLDELTTLVAEAAGYRDKQTSIDDLIEAKKLKENDKITFTTADGQTVNGVVQADGTVRGENGAVYSNVTRDWLGNYSTTENYSNTPAPEPEPEPESQKPELTTNDKKGVSAAIWNGGYGWGTGGTRTKRLKEVFGENDIQKNYVNKKVMSGYSGKLSDYSYDNMKKKFTAYKTGGLADFTGPAWLDGTKSKPEYILNADQTKAFFTLVDVLSGLQTGTPKSSEKTGDNTYDIDINVETIGSDYDVEQLATTVKRLINEDARYRNNNTINLTR